MPDSTNQCGLSGTSRTDIFHDIAVDELTQMINMDILASISATNYQRFIEFCDKVVEEKDSIISVSCVLEGEELEFFINYKE